MSDVALMAAIEVGTVVLHNTGDDSLTVGAGVVVQRSVMVRGVHAGCFIAECLLALTGFGRFCSFDSWTEVCEISLAND